MALLILVKKFQHFKSSYLVQELLLFNEYFLADSFKCTKTRKKFCSTFVVICFLYVQNSGPPMFYFTFQWSLNMHRVPKSWKQSIGIPVAKDNHPKAMYDKKASDSDLSGHYPWENCWKANNTVHRPDPLQFAYRTVRGVKDATATLFNLVLNHLEGKKKHFKLLFLEFLSAFSAIQPHSWKAH